MKLRQKLEIYNQCNTLLDEYEKEYPECIFIEDDFGDEVMETVGKKYGLSSEDVESIYSYVQIIFMENALNKLYLERNNQLN